MAAGGAFAWLVHMSGALTQLPRAGEVRSGCRGGGGCPLSRRDRFRRRGLQLGARRRRRCINRGTCWSRSSPSIRDRTARCDSCGSTTTNCIILFARAMSAAAERKPLPAAAALRAHRLVFLAGRPATFDGTADVDEMPLGRPRPWELLRDALTPGSPSLYVVTRAGIAVCISGFVASALGIEHAYWAMSAAVLVLHQGFDWVRTLQRGFERMVGTWVGLVLAAAVLTLHPAGAVAGADHRDVAVHCRDVDRAQLCTRSGVHHAARIDHRLRRPSGRRCRRSAVRPRNGHTDRLRRWRSWSTCWSGAVRSPGTSRRRSPACSTP